MHRGGRRHDPHRSRLSRLRSRRACEWHGRGCCRSLASLRQLRHLRQQILHRLRSLRRVFGEHLGQQHVELVGEGVVQLRRGWNRRIDRRVSDLHPIGAYEGQAACQHLKGQDAHRVDVTAAVDLVPHHLLGCHIAGSADGEPDGGQVGRLTGAAGQAEVGEHGAAVGVDEHVGGLEVAVNDPRIVGVL